MIRLAMCAVGALMAGVLGSAMTGNGMIGLVVGVVAGVIGLVVTRGMD